MFSQIQLLRTFVVILLFLTSSVLYAQSIEMRDLSRTLASDTLTLEEKRALVGTQAFYGNGENIFTINFQNRLNGNQWEIIATDKLGQTIGFGNFRILSTLGLFDSASKRLMISMETLPNIVSYKTQLVLGTLSGNAGDVDVYGEYTEIISPDGDETIFMRVLDGGTSIEELRERAAQNVQSRLNLDKVLQDLNGALYLNPESVYRSVAYFPLPVKPTFTKAVSPLIYSPFRNSFFQAPEFILAQGSCEQGCLIDTTINKSIALAEHEARVYEINLLASPLLVACQLLSYRPASSVCGTAVEALASLLIAESEEWRDEAYDLFDDFCLNCFANCP